MHDKNSQEAETFMIPTSLANGLKRSEFIEALSMHSAHGFIRRVSRYCPY